MSFFNINTTKHVFIQVLHLLVCHVSSAGEELARAEGDVLGDGREDLGVSEPLGHRQRVVHRIERHVQEEGLFGRVRGYDVHTPTCVCVREMRARVIDEAQQARLIKGGIRTKCPCFQ